MAGAAAESQISVLQREGAPLLGPEIFGITRYVEKVPIFCCKMFKETCQKFIEKYEGASLTNLLCTNLEHDRSLDIESTDVKSGLSYFRYFSLANNGLIHCSRLEYGNTIVSEWDVCNFNLVKILCFSQGCEGKFKGHTSLYGIFTDRFDESYIIPLVRTAPYLRSYHRGAYRDHGDPIQMAALIQSQFVIKNYLEQNQNISTLEEIQVFSPYCYHMRGLESGLINYISSGMDLAFEPGFELPVKISYFSIPFPNNIICLTKLNALQLVHQHGCIPDLSPLAFPSLIGATLEYTINEITIMQKQEIDQNHALQIAEQAQPIWRPAAAHEGYLPPPVPHGSSSQYSPDMLHEITPLSIHTNDSHQEKFIYPISAEFQIVESNKSIRYSNENGFYHYVRGSQFDVNVKFKPPSHMFNEDSIFLAIELVRMNPRFRHIPVNTVCYKHRESGQYPITRAYGAEGDYRHIEADGKYVCYYKTKPSVDGIVKDRVSLIIPCFQSCINTNCARIYTREGKSIIEEARDLFLSFKIQYLGEPAANLGNPELLPMWIKSGMKIADIKKSERRFK